MKWCWKSTYGSFDRRRAELPDAVARATGMLYKIKDEEGAGHEEGRKKWKLQSSKGSGRGECLCECSLGRTSILFFELWHVAITGCCGSSIGRYLEVNNMLGDRIQRDCEVYEGKEKLHAHCTRDAFIASTIWVAMGKEV